MRDTREGYEVDTTYRDTIAEAARERIARGRRLLDDAVKPFASHQELLFEAQGVLNQAYGLALAIKDADLLAELGGIDESSLLRQVHGLQMVLLGKPVGDVPLWAWCDWHGEVDIAGDGDHAGGCPGITEMVTFTFAQ